MCACAGLFELHGNSNVERCTKCGMDYLRDYSVRTARGVMLHKTGLWHVIDM